MRAEDRLSGVGIVTGLAGSVAFSLVSFDGPDSHRISNGGLHRHLPRRRFRYLQVQK